MASELAELLRELIDEIKGLRQDFSAQTSEVKEQEKRATATQEKQTSQKDTIAAQKTAGDFKKFSSAYQSGDIRSIAQSAGQIVGGGKGGQIAGAVSEIASLFGPRGYNAFNIFEKYDATKVKPFQQVEDLAYQYGKYGVQISDEKLLDIYKNASMTEQRGFAERERVRKLISTSALSAMLNQVGIGGGEQVEKFVEEMSSSAKNFASPDDKAQGIAKKYRDMNKSVSRQDKFDDNY